MSIWRIDDYQSVNAIIFLVPVNCFDEVLEEDENVNRLVSLVLPFFLTLD